MSEADLEEQKKVVLPFMQRAQEMQTADPKVAYYCRMYAVEQAFKFEKRAKEINGLVSAALAQMEKEKPRLGLDKENDRFHCEALALKVFGNADKVDRAGRSDLGTAKTFLAASYFLEILNHFGPVDADLLDKQRYAAWRAAEIRKAVREGRPALPPSAAKEQAPGDELPDAYSGASASSGSAATAAAAAAAAAFDALPPAYSSSASMGSAHTNTLPSVSSGPPQQSWAAAEPPSLPFPPSAPVSAAAFSAPPAPAPPGQRFRPGSRLLYLPPGAEGPELGTVGQVMPGGPGAAWCYNLALRDRLEVVSDDGRQVAPNLSEGDAVLYLAGRAGPAPAHVLMIQDMSWPPSFMLRLQDGKEVVAEAHEVSLLEPAAAAAAATAPRPEAQPAPPPPVQQQQQQPYAPPPLPQQQQPAQPHFPPVMPHYQPPQHQQPHAPPPPPLAPAPALPPGHKPSVQAIMDAQKNAKYAVSSLNFEDVPAAVKYLQTALRLLTTP